MTSPIRQALKSSEAGDDAEDVDLGDVPRVGIGVDRAVGLGATGDLEEVVAQLAVLATRGLQDRVVAERLAPGLDRDPGDVAARSTRRP